jgi:hypothetical protein
MKNSRQVLAAYRSNDTFTIDEAEAELLNLYNVINWVAVSEKLPTRMDEDYLVCVRNKNKEGGIPIQDIGNFSSDGVWIKQNTWEEVVYWAELPKPPCL